MAEGVLPMCWECATAAAAVVGSHGWMLFVGRVSPFVPALYGREGSWAGKSCCS